MRSSAAVSEAGGAAVAAVAVASCAARLLLPGRQHGRVRHAAGEALGVQQARERVGHVAQAPGRPAAEDPQLGVVPGREVDQPRLQPRGGGEVGARLLAAALVGAHDRRGGEHERGHGRVLEVVAVDLRARTRHQLARLGPVLALDGEDAELREAERVERRRRDRRAPGAGRERVRRRLAVAEQVVRGARDELAERRGDVVAGELRQAARGVLDPARKPVVAERGAERGQAAEHRRRRVGGRRDRGRGRPVRDEVAATGEQLQSSRRRARARGSWRSGAR